MVASSAAANLCLIPETGGGGWKDEEAAQEKEGKEEEKKVEDAKRRSEVKSLRKWQKKKKKHLAEGRTARGDRMKDAEKVKQGRTGEGIDVVENAGKIFRKMSVRNDESVVGPGSVQICWSFTQSLMKIIFVNMATLLGQNTLWCGGQSYRSSCPTSLRQGPVHLDCQQRGLMIH